MSDKLDQLRINAAIEEIEVLRAIAEQLAEALKELEWPGDISAAVTGKAIVECPSCETFYGKGHRDDCQLAAALATWKEWNRESAKAVRSAER